MPPPPVPAGNAERRLKFAGGVTDIRGVAFSGVRNLGKTGLAVGPLGIASTFGREPEDLSWAYEMGCNYLVLRHQRQPWFFKQVRELVRSERDNVVLGFEPGGHCLALLRLRLELILRRLGTDRLDLLLLGQQTRTELPAWLDSAEALKAKGKLRYIGLAVAQPEREIPLIQAVWNRIDVLHLRVNASRPLPDPIGKLVQSRPARGPALVATSATNQGRLVRPHFGIHRTPTVADCYRYVLGMPGIDLCMAGSPRPSDVRDTFDALARGPMSDEELSWMDEFGQEVANSRPATQGTHTPRRRRTHPVPASTG